jgi:protein-S-isoprenylcysteine O-methyltransferase Ste14
MLRLILQRYFSGWLRVLQDHKLITFGICKYVRHSAYLGFLLGGFGVTMLFNSFYVSFIVLSMIPFFLYRIKLEERMLQNKFGSEFTDYVKRSSRLIPFLY